MRLVATELLAPTIRPFVKMGSPFHHFWRICGVVCSRAAEEVVCPCLRSSSDQLQGRGWASVKLMRTPPLEVGRRSTQLVVGQRADSLSLLELDVWLAAEAEELVATLALRKVQCLLRPLLGDTLR